MDCLFVITENSVVERGFCEWTNADYYKCPNTYSGAVHIYLLAQSLSIYLSVARVADLLFIIAGVLLLAVQLRVQFKFDCKGEWVIVCAKKQK